jgi:hypothetical protein
MRTLTSTQEQLQSIQIIAARRSVAASQREGIFADGEEAHWIRPLLSCGKSAPPNLAER